MVAQETEPASGATLVKAEVDMDAATRRALARIAIRVQLPLHIVVRDAVAMGIRMLRYGPR